MKLITHFRNIYFRLSVIAAMTLFAAVSYGKDEEESDHSKHVGMEGQIEELRAEVARLKAAVAADHEAAPLQSNADHKAHAESGEGQAPSVGQMSGTSGEMKMTDGMQIDKMGMEKGMKMMEMGMGMMKGMGMGKMPGDSDMAMGKSDASKGMKMMEMGMGMMKGMGMGKMSGDSDMAMGKPDASKGMKMMEGMKMMGGMGMKMMGKMPDSSMANTSLPGFAGASHIYHIGSSGYFLDHSDHLKLNADQQRKINSIKETSVLAQNESDRQIASAEEALWKLTSIGEPDSAAIEAKLKEIAELNVQKRLQFISSVGETAEVLTQEQLGLLTGEGQSNDVKEKPSKDEHQHDKP